MRKGRRERIEKGSREEIEKATKDNLKRRRAGETPFIRISRSEENQFLEVNAEERKGAERREKRQKGAELTI